MFGFLNPTTFPGLEYCLTTHRVRGLCVRSFDFTPLDNIFELGLFWWIFPYYSEFSFVTNIPNVLLVETDISKTLHAVSPVLVIRYCEDSCINP